MRHRREVGVWLMAEGYKYKAMDFQDPRFEVEIAECVKRRPNGIYSMPGVMAILTFVRPVPGPRSESVEGEAEAEVEGQSAPRELKVQVIIAKNTPMEVILGFHSSKPPSPALSISHPPAR